MNDIAILLDGACKDIATWLPDDPHRLAIRLLLAILGGILAWMLLPLFIARIVVSRRAGRARLRLRTQVADRWRGIIGKAFTVPTVVLAVLYSLYQVGQISQAARKAAEATFIENHKVAFDALAKDDVGHHIAATLALGQLVKKKPQLQEDIELREDILSALSTNSVAWSPLAPASTQDIIKPDARTALNVISSRSRDNEIDCKKKQEVETTFWFEGGNFRGMPFPILEDKDGKRLPVQLDRVDFYRSNLSGSDLFCASLGYANLNRTILDGANLMEANFCGALLINASLLPGENLASPGLQGRKDLPVQAHKANFTKAHLQNAKLSKVVFEEAVLDGAWLDQADATGASLKCARAEGAHFNGATLEGSDFSKAFLKGADFTNAIVNNETTWDNANLESATFSESPDLVLKLRKEKARLCRTKVGNTPLNDNCTEIWKDPPEGCFTKPETEVCSPNAYRP